MYRKNHLKKFVSGLSGFFPIHPRTYITAWRNRKNQQEADSNKQEMKSESQ